MIPKGQLITNRILPFKGYNIMKKILIILIIVLFLRPFLSATEPNISLVKLWETNSLFMTPESVVFDSVRNCLYVSNFNDKGGFRENTDTIFDECISKVDLAGNIIALRWVDHLIGPTGITIFHDTLYVVERGFLTKIDINQQSILERIPIPDTEILNDVVVDKDGAVYISDTKANGAIYKVANGKSELWLTDSILQNSNGLYLDQHNLIIGNRGVSLIEVNISDKTIKIVASNIADNIDGIRKIKQGYLVSWRHNLFMINEQGVPTTLLSTNEGDNWNADFEWIEKENLLIVPTLISNKLMAYEISIEQ